MKSGIRSVIELDETKLYNKIVGWAVSQLGLALENMSCLYFALCQFRQHFSCANLVGISKKCFYPTSLTLTTSVYCLALLHLLSQNVIALFVKRLSFLICVAFLLLPNDQVLQNIISTKEPTVNKRGAERIGRRKNDKLCR